MLKIVALAIPILRTSSNGKEHSKEHSKEDIFIWLQKRRSSTRINDGLSELLEFPGGKIENGETAEQAALRELLEETHFVGCDLPKLFKIYRHDYKDCKVILYACLQDLTNTSNDFFKTGELFSLKNDDMEFLEKRVLEGSRPLLWDLKRYFFY